MMFAPRLKTVFASRWNALFWSLGVLLTAYYTVPIAHEARQQRGAHSSSADQAPRDTAAMVEDRREAFERARRLERAMR